MEKRNTSICTAPPTCRVKHADCTTATYGSPSLIQCTPRSRTFRQERRAVAERRFSPRRKSARWQGALSRGRGCHASGSAWHTNTDNAHPVQLWVGGCGTAPGDMPGIRDRQCGADSGGHEERRPTPLGRGAHRRRRDADDSGAWTRHRAGCGHTSEEGWMRPPPTN